MLEEFLKKDIDCYIIFKVFSIEEKIEEAIECFQSLPESRMEEVITTLDLKNTM